MLKQCIADWLMVDLENADRLFR